MTRIGFIGLGTMGGPMAYALHDAGFDLIGMDVSTDIRAGFDGAVAPSSGQRTPFGAEAAKAFTAFAETSGDRDFSAFYTTLRALPGQPQD